MEINESLRIANELYEQTNADFDREARAINPNHVLDRTKGCQAFHIPLGNIEGFASQNYLPSVP